MRGSIAVGCVVSDREIITFEEQERTLSFFKSVIRQHSTDRPILLLLTDQNLRRVFDELDAPTVQDQPLSLKAMLEDRPQIRVARLRYSHHDEAPLCVPTVPRSKYPGLYGHSAVPNLFYSLQNVGDQEVHKDAHRMDRLQGKQCPCDQSVYHAYSAFQPATRRQSRDMGGYRSSASAGVVTYRDCDTPATAASYHQKVYRVRFSGMLSMIHMTRASRMKMKRPTA